MQSMRPHALSRWLLLLGLTAPAAAQSVSGRVLQTLQDRPLAGALVQVRDASGSVVSQGTTNSKGTFLLQLRQPGTYRWRVAAIGFTPTALTSFMLTPAGVVLPTVSLAPLARQLVDIESRGQSACGLRRGDAPLFDGVLSAAETALDVMEQTVLAGEIHFEVLDSMVVTRAATMPADSLTKHPLAFWPVRAVDLGLLETRGFSELDSSAALVRHYYGPDARVLSAPWFLATHCYSFDQKARATDSLITLRFEPSSRTRIDIAGEMQLDRQTLSLRRIRWEHRNLPKWIHPEDTGGYLIFSQLDDAIWYPSQWSLRAPVETRRTRGPLDPGGESQTLTAPVVGTVERISRVTRVVKN